MQTPKLTPDAAVTEPASQSEAGEAPAARPIAAARSLDALRSDGYDLPAPGEPVRIAFVGQTTYFSCCALDRPAAQLDPTFIEFRAGGDLERMQSEVAAYSPHVVFVFRPELMPAGIFDSINALTVGYFTEPLPRSQGSSHPDLGRRLEYMRELRPANFDRLMSFDPLIAETIDSVASDARIWRSAPLPVADYVYAPVRHAATPPRALFIGRSTKYREKFLGEAKHAHDVMHIAHGVSGEELVELFSRYDVSINIHNEYYPSFENRVCLSLAAGLLVVSERLSPTHGLEPGIDHVEVRLSRELDSALFRLRQFPDLYRRIRVMGRMKAEQFRASRVYPRLIGDLLLDVAAFGSSRKRGA